MAKVVVVVVPPVMVVPRSVDIRVLSNRSGDATPGSMVPAIE